MSRNWARFLAGIVSIAIVWIAAYWWINPRPPAKISFGSSNNPARTPLPKAPPPQPRAPLKIVDVKREAAPASRGTTQSPAPAAQVPTATTPPPVQAPVAQPQPAKPTPQPVKPAVIPPTFVDYTVRSGDTLTSIATARLGSTRYIDAIRRSNPLKDLDKLKTGDVIRIPTDPANIQGKPAAGSPPPAPPTDRQGEILEYTVRSGDTLSKIAKEKYGSSAFQDFIYQANRDRLSSPNALKEGQKLRLPKKPAS